MNRRLKKVLLFLVDPRSLILALAVFNLVHVWVLCSHASGGAMVPPWYFPWGYFNEPTLLLAAAVFLRINRIWSNCVSCVLSGYLLGYFVRLFAIYPEGIRVALHYEWISLKQGPFIDSWDSQYLFAFIIFCCSIFYLAQTTLRRVTLNRTTDNKALQLTAR
jgi:hypothetical protein